MADKTNTNNDKVDKLLAYLAKKIEENKPENAVYFILDILCVYYPKHIPSFSRVWHFDKELDHEKQNVREFFKYNNSTSTIAQHFINSGFDSLESLKYLTVDVLDDIQNYNNVKWLPGHRVRVHQIFENIEKLVDEYIENTKAYKTTTLHYVVKSPETNVLHKLDHQSPTKFNASGYYYQTPVFDDLVLSNEPPYAGNPKSHVTCDLKQLATLSAEAATMKAVDNLTAQDDEDDKKVNACCTLK